MTKKSTLQPNCCVLSLCIHIFRNTQVRLTSSQLLSSRQSTLEQARKSTNSEQTSAHRYAHKSSRIRNEDLTDVTPVIPEDPFYPTNFTTMPRIQTRYFLWSRILTHANLITIFKSKNFNDHISSKISLLNFSSTLLDLFVFKHHKF